jgi:type IV pilus assembly protein PilY1
VGIAGAQISVSRNFAYRTTYGNDQSGDVQKYALDPNTGALPINDFGNPRDDPVWSAVSKLDAQAAVTGWDTNRRIVTLRDDNNRAVPFRANQLSSAQQASLNAGWVAANVTPAPTADMVANYLRGDPSNEGVGVTNFRVRTHILGDIVYSGAVPVAGPAQPYADPGYVDFANNKRSRTPMVYVGSNDGMLHAFNDSVGTDAGKEAWAYVPKAMFIGGDPNDTAHTPSPAFQIGALTYGSTGAPLFSPKFYVNATPRIWDVDFRNTNTSTPPSSANDWHTILVGGLGAGGRAIYALDVTTPVELSDPEADAATRVLWEKTYADPGFENLGHVFDAPTLVKTKRFGWVALVVSGYNNADGIGRLYVLDPKNGNLLVPPDKLSTGVGTPLQPSGLSTVRAFTSSRRDPYVLQAYSGDLLGNVWRFDLSDPNEANWKVELIAKLTDRPGKPQPITTGVRIEIDQNNNVDRYLFVGTGKLLGVDDRTPPGINDIKDSSVVNSLYVIRDGTRLAAEPAPANQSPARAPYSRDDLNAVNASDTSGIFRCATGRGWYQDATDPTEKIGTDVYADVQTVVYAFSKPSTDPCAPPLSSRLYARDLTTGNSVLESPRRRHRGRV